MAGVSSKFDADTTRQRELSPWEIAKAAAYKSVLEDVAHTLDTPAAALVGQRVDVYVASKLTVKGGGHPSERAVRQVLGRCSDPARYPGKPARTSGKKAGRPPVIAHIRRLLAIDFAQNRLHESMAHFRQRMKKVEDYMNSDRFSAPNGTGLLGLAKSLRSRCEGERLPK